MTELNGYLRPDGRWGFRDHLLVLPLHSALCDAAQQIADSADREVVAVRHDWDEPDEHLDAGRITTVLAGYMDHPNVGGLVVLGLGSDLDPYRDVLERTTVPYRVVRLDECGSFDRFRAEGERALSEVIADHVPPVRETAPWTALCVGLECGSSDAFSGITANPALGVASDRLVEGGGSTILAETTELLGAEHLLAKRAVTEEIGRQIVEMVTGFERDVARHGVDLLGSQPAPGNIAGGLTTIEEKSLGAARKGGAGPISGVLKFAERVPGSGLYIMDTPGQDIEQMTAMVAAGAQVVAFTTGKGTPSGSPIAPCIKISSNTHVAQSLPDLIDIDAGRIIEGKATLEEVGAEILSEIFEVASGRETKAEVRRNREFALSRMRPMGV